MRTRRRLTFILFITQLVQQYPLHRRQQLRQHHPVRPHGGTPFQHGGKVQAEGAAKAGAQLAATARQRFPDA